MYILIAIFSGFTIVLSILMLGRINKQVGLLPTTFVSFSVGSVGAIFLLLVTHKTNFQTLQDVPIYLYFGFVIVISITMLNGTLINKIPATYGTILVFIGQLVTGILMDFFRFHKLSYGDLIGGIVLLLGLYYNSRVDKFIKEGQA